MWQVGSSLLMYNMQASKYTRTVQVPCGMIDFSRQHKAWKFSMGKWVPSVTTLIWKLATVLLLELNSVYEELGWRSSKNFG
jgi:hypothetical protein